MAGESQQQKLTRVRKPRVHITYEVETEGAVVMKELPFVVGVMGDFSGDPTEKLKPLKDRKFIQIDRDNFNEVMQAMNPTANSQAVQPAHAVTDDHRWRRVEFERRPYHHARERGDDAGHDVLREAHDGGAPSHLE